VYKRLGPAIFFGVVLFAASTWVAAKMEMVRYEACLTRGWFCQCEGWPSLVIGK